MPYGILAADQISTSVTGVSLGAGNATRFKNRIINGDMRIDQRNAGASVATTTTGAQVYTIDRWSYSCSQASKYTVQQNAGSVTPPTGFTNYLGITSTSAYSVTSSDYFQITQPIEGLNVADLGWGTADAKTVTLSFWVRSSLTGTFGGAILNSAGNRCYPFSYTISSANTWTQISVTIAGDTTGTWLTTNGIGLGLRFSLGVGSDFVGTAGSWTTSLKYPSSTSVVGTNGATFYITGVQLEVGSSATGFEYVDYTMQLAMCQRYCQVWGAGSSQILGVAWEYSSTAAVVACLRPVQMRTAPSLTYSAVGDWTVFSGGAGNYTATAIAQNRTSINSMSIEFAVASGLTAGQAGAVYTGNSSARIYESAEL